MDKKVSVQSSRQFSLGLLEMAARSTNLSLFGMMPDQDKLDAARGLKMLTKKDKPSKKRR